VYLEPQVTYPSKIFLSTLCRNSDFKCLKPLISLRSVNTENCKTGLQLQVFVTWDPGGGTDGGGGVGGRA